MDWEDFLLFLIWEEKDYSAKITVDCIIHHLHTYRMKKLSSDVEKWKDNWRVINLIHHQVDMRNRDYIRNNPY